METQRGSWRVVRLEIDSDGLVKGANDGDSEGMLLGLPSGLADGMVLGKLLPCLQEMPRAGCWGSH